MVDGALPSPEGLVWPQWQAVLQCLAAAVSHMMILQHEQHELSRTYSISTQPQKMPFTTHTHTQTQTHASLMAIVPGQTWVSQFLFNFPSPYILFNTILPCPSQTEGHGAMGLTWPLQPTTFNIHAYHTFIHIPHGYSRSILESRAMQVTVSRYITCTLTHSLYTDDFNPSPYFSGYCQSQGPQQTLSQR